MNRVKAGCVYYFVPNLLDRIDGRTDLKHGAAVRVVNLPGCPKANVMGHCHVADPETGRFIGLVHVNSLQRENDYIAYLRREIADRA
jgi:hypothetical protein